MSKNKVEDLKKHLSEMSTRERFKEIIRLKAIDRRITDSLSPEEDDLLNLMAGSIYNPMKKNEQGKFVLDKEKFLENMKMVAEVTVENAIDCGEEIALWKNYFDKKKPEKFERIGHSTIAHNMELAKTYARDSSIGSMHMVASQDMIFSIGQDILKAMKNNWYEILMQSPELKKQFEYQNECSVQDFAKKDYLSAYNAIYDFNVRQIINKKPEKDRILYSMGKDVAHDQLKSTDDLQESNPVNGLDFLSAKILLDQPMAKKTTKERLALMSQNRLFGGIYYEQKTDELLKSAMNTLKIYDVMKRDYNSLLYNTGSYNEMRTSIRALRQKMTEYGLMDNNGQKNNITEDQEEALTNLLSDVMKKTTQYISDHAERRASDNGKGRFNCAMAILGTIDYDKALLVGYTVNKIRSASASKDKQLVNVDKILAEQNVERGGARGVMDVYKAHKEVKKLDKQLSVDNMVATYKAIHTEEMHKAKESIYQNKPEIAPEKIERSKMSLDVLLEKKKQKEEKSKDTDTKKKSKVGKMLDKEIQDDKKKIKDKYGIVK